MPEITMAPSIVAVVASEVLGVTAVSVPIEADYSNPDYINFAAIPRAVIEDEMDRRETQYLDSTAKPAPEDAFVVLSQPFRDHMEVAINSGADNWDTVADRACWWRTANDRPDGRRPDGAKVRYYVMDSDHIPGDIAVELAAAMDMDPHEAGL
jgi:hypothetical protein